MSDARLAALEAVAEAAEILAHSAGVIRGRTPEDADIYTHELEHIRHLMAMLSTLDALPAQPQPAGETVVLAMWKSGVDSYAFTDPEARELFSKMTEWTRLGTTTLRLDTEVRT